MKFIITLIASALLLAANPINDVVVDAAKEKTGATACAFPLLTTREGHLWVSHLYRNPEGCIFALKKQVNGQWKMLPTGIPLKRVDSRYSDAELSQYYGWFIVDWW